MSGYRLRLEVRELPRSNASDNVHWRTKVADRARWGLLLRRALGRQAKPPKPLARARVRFTRYSSVEPDYRNLVGCFKLIEDILQPQRPYQRKSGSWGDKNPGGLGIIAGDDPAHIVTEHRWEQAPRKEGRVVIEIEEL